jgi:hypothetical protein
MVFAKGREGGGGQEGGTEPDNPTTCGLVPDSIDPVRVGTDKEDVLG